MSGVKQQYVKTTNKNRSRFGSSVSNTDKFAFVVLTHRYTEFNCARTFAKCKERDRNPTREFVGAPFYVATKIQINETPRRINSRRGASGGVDTYVYAEGNGGQLKGVFCKTIKVDNGENINKCWGDGGRKTKLHKYKKEIYIRSCFCSRISKPDKFAFVVLTMPLL